MDGPTSEQLFRSIQRGMEATGELSVVDERLNARKTQLIADAVTAFTAIPSQMDGTQALLFVAALSENERLRTDLKNLESEGRRAAKKLQAQ